MASRRRSQLKLAVTVTLALAFVWLLAAPVWADFSGRAWRFSKPIELPPGLPQEGLVELAPDREVYASATPGLADIRVVAVEGQREVPYKLLVERGERRRTSMVVTIRDLGHVPGQYTSFVADLGQSGLLHNELEVLTPSQNFQRRLTVEASPDGNTWATLRQDGQIFDFTDKSRNFTARDTRARYPSSTARYLRIRIANDSELPLQISGAVAYLTQELPAREAEVAATIVSRQEEPSERRTLLVLDLGSQGFPTGRIAVATAQDNFYRQVRVEAGDDARTWTPLEGSEAIYSYKTPRFTGSKLFVSYPETGSRYFRLAILNEDNPPLPITEARATGALRKLIFSASPNLTYRLYYGNADARAPSYELERLFPYLVTENLPVARLGSHAANPLFATPPKPFTERYPWLLPTVVAVAALFIGLFLASLFRQVRKLLPPPSP